VKTEAHGIWNWLRSNVDLVMLGALAVLVIGSWVFIEVADEVLEGDAEPYDEWVLRSLRVPGDPTDPVGPPWFEAIWRDLTALGSAAVLSLVTLACAGYLLIRKRYRVLVVLTVVIIGGVVLSLAMKALFDRPRPEYASQMTHVVSASFPSGHSMLSAVVYLTLSVLLARTADELRYKIYFIGLGLVVTLLVGLSRIYLGVHYPSDVLAGWSAGATWALLCWLILYFLQKSAIIAPPKVLEDNR